MADDELLKAKMENAIQVTETLIAFLRTVGLDGWAERYSQILAALREGESTRAIELRKSFVFGGPGSLSDVMLEEEAQRRFDKLVGAQATAIANIRLFLSYGADRPLVVIDNVL